jgi:hypothetical protein
MEVRNPITKKVSLKKIKIVVESNGGLIGNYTLKLLQIMIGEI